MKKNLLIAGICVAVLVYLVWEASGADNDFSIYLHAATDLFKGGDIYSIHYGDGYRYYYSIFFAIVLFPLNYLPEPMAKFIWLSANAFLLYRIIRIMAGYFDLTVFTEKKKWIFFLLCFAFGLEFISTNFENEQVTILILYFALQGLQYVFSGKKFLGALFIALGINIKILPIVLIPYLLYRREIKASALIVIIYAILLAFPGFIIGFHHNNELLASWWNLINPANTQHILDVDERTFHSLSTLLATLFVEKVPDSHALPIKRNIANITPQQLTCVLNTVRFVLIAFALYFLHTRPFTAIKNKSHQLWEVSYLLLLVPLIFPHQQIYGFLFTVPAACYILYYLFTQKKTLSKAKYSFLVGGFAISYLACNIRFLFGQFYEYYLHFKVLTYGALLLIPILAFCVPKEVSLSQAAVE